MRATWMTILLPLAACAATDAKTPPAAVPDVKTGGKCDNAGLERFIGKAATAQLGAEMLKASGARAMRWGGPNAIMTMDYRQDRLTVSYDETMIVTGARCG